MKNTSKAKYYPLPLNINFSVLLNNVTFYNFCCFESGNPWNKEQLIRFWDYSDLDQGAVFPLFQDYNIGFYVIKY